MNGLPYYKAYPRDFIEGTVGMPFEMKAAYRLVLDLIYMQGGRLPDEPRYIAGLLGCSVKKWNGLRSALIEAGKIFVIDEFLANYRADKELEILGKFQDQQRKNRSKPNKNKDIQTPRFDHTEPEPDTDIGGGGSACAREVETRQAEPSDRERILAAIGLGPDGVAGPSRFLGTQGDMAEAARWMEMPGLSVDVICAEVARIMACKSDGPPASFKYFTGAMQRLSGQLSAPALQPLTPKAIQRGQAHVSETRAFDRAINELADRLADGTATLYDPRRDPFAHIN
jgi:uncharacterized protein YdaU (DUF1376 family)